MNDIKYNMKQINLDDLEENFEQVLGDVIVSSEPVKIMSDADDAILIS